MRITYLSIDSLTEGVGASQVLAYVEKLAYRGLEVELHTYEKRVPPSSLEERLKSAGVVWHVHDFGRFGSLGGLGRVLRARRFVRDAELVHARSDLAAAASLVANTKRWVWDFRSFYVDQKIELNELKAGSLQEKVLRWIEKQSATKSAGIIVLTKTAIPVLAEKFGKGVVEKTHVITTCVDTQRFMPQELIPAPPLKLLLSGTVNSYYDVPLMIEFVNRVRTKIPVEFETVGPTSAKWQQELANAGARASTVDFESMPDVVAAQHAGLSVCREDAGVSLKGAMPTKIGEFLASGRPVIVNPSLGDIASSVQTRRCGVVIEDRSSDGIDAAADRLLELVADSGTPQRCRDLALEEFDLDKAIDKLISIYDSITA